FLCLRLPRPPPSPLFPYTTLFRSVSFTGLGGSVGRRIGCPGDALFDQPAGRGLVEVEPFAGRAQAPRMGVGFDEFQGHRSIRVRSEEHTSELQSRENLVCRLLLEK